MIAKGGLMASLRAKERKYMNKTIAVIRGDGIGPEIVGEALGVLDAVAARFHHSFIYREAPMGGCAIDEFGVPLPDSSLETCLHADSVLLGAVGGPKWDSQPSANRPERGLLKLREAMGLYTNVRPARMFSDLSAACPLRSDIAAKGIDFVVVRELIGGVYFGQHTTTEIDGEQKAVDIMSYTEHEIRRGGPRGLSDGQKAAQAGHLRGQGQCAGHLPSVAKDRDGGGGGVPGCGNFCTCMWITPLCRSSGTPASLT